MKIIKGFVLDVMDKGEGDKKWAIVGIQTTSKDRDGFDITETVKLRVFGDLAKQGLQNAYRALKGTEVFAPYNDEFDERFSRISYSLTGAPLSLVEKPAQTGPRPAPEQQKVG